MSGLMDEEPKFFVVGFNTAICYADLRQPERCVQAFRDVLDRFPDRVGDVVELFATSSTELHATLDSQPELVRSLLERCPELFQDPASDGSSQASADAQSGS